jgi:hypothetical protein
VATNLTRLNVALTMSTGAFVNATKAAGSAVSSLGSSLKDSLLSPLTAVAGLLSTGAIIAGLKSSADRIDALAKSADRLGISTESFAGLSHAAQQSGSSAEAMVTGMEKLTKTVEEAAAGSKTAKASLDALGLSAYALVGIPADQQMAKVADAMNGLAGAGERTRAAIDIFGRGGGGLVNTLALGSSGLADMTKEAEKLGVALSRADAAQVEAAGDAMSNAGTAVKGLFDTAMVAMAPFVKAAADGFVDLVKRVRDWGFNIENVAKYAKYAFALIADAWQVVTIAFKAGKAYFATYAQVFWVVADEGARAFKVIGQFIANWYMGIWETTKTVGMVFNVLWNGVKFAALKAFAVIGDKFADLLFLMSDGARAAGLDIAGELTTAAHAVGRTAAAASAKANADMGESINGLVKQAGDAKDAWSNLFKIDTTYVDSIHRIREVAGNVAEQSRTEFKDALAAPWDSVRVFQWGDAVQASAIKAGQAVADAKKIANATTIPTIDTSAMDKKLADMLGNTGIETTEQLELIKHEEKLVKIAELNQYYDDIGQSRSMELNTLLEAEEQRHQDAMGKMLMDRYQQGLSGASSFFANLSTLQSSNSKTARSVGKAAAKAKIGMDTASAAMGAYSAMASIPFVGPVLGIAAAAAAVVAGAQQLSNVDKADGGGGVGSAPQDVSTSNIGGVSAPAQRGQTLLLQGDFFSAESVIRLLDDARERGVTIDGARRA